jgi:hypothetical protein
MSNENKESDAPMTTERKTMIAVSWLCMVVFAGSIIAIAFYAHPIAGLLALALVALWLGSSIAAVLKDSRKELK